MLSSTVRGVYCTVSLVLSLVSQYFEQFEVRHALCIITALNSALTVSSLIKLVT